VAATLTPSSPSNIDLIIVSSKVGLLEKVLYISGSSLNSLDSDTKAHCLSPLSVLDIY
jgi:hypothetical protein